MIIKYKDNKEIRNLDKLPLLREPPQLYIFSEYLRDIQGIRVMSIGNRRGCIYIREAKKLKGRFRVSLLLNCYIRGVTVEVWDGGGGFDKGVIKTVIPIRQVEPPEAWKPYHIKLPITLSYTEDNKERFVECARGDENTFTKNVIIDDKFDIVWIVGPVAFGKTTLASCIAETLRNQGWKVVGDPIAQGDLILRIGEMVNRGEDLKNIALTALGLPVHDDCGYNMAIILDEYDILYKETGSLAAGRTFLRFVVDYMKRRLSNCSHHRTVIIGLESPSSHFLRSGSDTCVFLRNLVNNSGFSVPSRQSVGCFKLNKFSKSLLENLVSYLPLHENERRGVVERLWNRAYGHPMLTMMELYAEMNRKVEKHEYSLCKIVKYCVEHKIVGGRRVPRFSERITERVIEEIIKCGDEKRGIKVSQPEEYHIELLRFLEAQGLCYSYTYNEIEYIKLLPLLTDCYVRRNR